VLGCVLGRVSGEPGGLDSPERKALAELMANLGLITAATGNEAANGDLPQRILHLLYDATETIGVRALLTQIRSVALAVRDRFSGDTWRILGRLDADANSRPARLPVTGATRLVHNLVLDLAAFNGMEMENMTRGRGWRFLDAGRRLERGLSVLKLLQATVAVQNSQPGAALETVLEIADSVMTYRRQYFAAPQLSRVLMLLLQEESNPRSLAFQVNLLCEHANVLMAEPNASTPEKDQHNLSAFAQALRVTNWDGLAAEEALSRKRLLKDLLGNWAKELASFSDDLTKRFFNHITPRFK